MINLQTTDEELLQKIWHCFFYHVCLKSAQVEYYKAIPDRFISDAMVCDENIWAYYDEYWGRRWDSRESHAFFAWLYDFDRRNNREVW